jgi:glucans biosynthesis protein
MHGGAKGSGAPKGSRNGSFKHGAFTCEAIEERRNMRELIADVREKARALR